MPRYSYPTDNTLAGLIQDQGRIRAQQAYAHGQSGQIWANALSNVGQIAGQAIQQHGLRKEEEKEKLKAEEQLALQREVVQKVLQNPEAPEAFPMLVDALGADGANKVFSGMAAYKKLIDPETPPEEAQLTLPQLFDGWEAGGKDPKVWRTVVNTYGTKMGQKIGPEWWQPTEKNVSQVKAMVDQLRPQAPEPKPDTASIDVRIANAYQAGDTDLVERLLALKSRASGAARVPAQPKESDPVADELQQLRLDAARRTAKKAEEQDDEPERVKLSATSIEKIAGIDQAASLAKAMSSRVKDEWLGPVAGRWAEGKIGLPGVDVPEDLARFFADTATLKNATVKAITGAQMSEPEAKRIMKQIPVFTDKKSVWQAKAKATAENLNFLRQRIIALSKGEMPPEIPWDNEEAGGPVTVVHEGQAFQFPTQDAADSFKRDMGIK